MSWITTLIFTMGIGFGATAPTPLAEQVCNPAAVAVRAPAAIAIDDCCDRCPPWLRAICRVVCGDCKDREDRKICAPCPPKCCANGRD